MENIFGDYLKELRLKREYSINQLALKSDVSGAHISRLENGLRPPPSPEIINKLAKALGVKPNKFMELAGYIQERPTLPEQKIKDALSGDPELSEFWESLSQREDLKILFKQTRDMSPEAIKRIIRYIKIVEDEEASEEF
jgi:transcriptional regulator with XRE-family HTH domain